MTLVLSERFYRVAAVASFVSAVTTLLLILLPVVFAPAEGFEGRMARVADPAYVMRSWAYALHPLVTFTAALAVAMRLRRIAPAAALVGGLGFHAWALTEFAQQMLTLAAFDRWRAAGAGADAAARALIQMQTAVYDGLWDAMYWTLLVAFVFGNVAFGQAMVRRRGMTRLVGGLYIAAALLTIAIISGEMRGPALPQEAGFWVYLLLQPLARTLIGVWLWRNSDETVESLR